MTEPREALAALLHSIECDCPFDDSPGCHLIRYGAFRRADRLIAAGVHLGDEGLRAAAYRLANEAARAVTEPRRFHANEEQRQQALGHAISAVRAALAAQEGETP